MISTVITCDKCGQEIKDSVCTLLYDGLLGHNQVPPNGWQFHYNCFCVVVNAIRGVLPDRATRIKPPDRPDNDQRPISDYL